MDTVAEPPMALRRGNRAFILSPCPSSRNHNPAMELEMRSPNFMAGDSRRTCKR